MILGSHNSWSYLRPKKWWMRLIAFTARCQRKTIREQYDLGVRCFDLRVRFDDEGFHVCHGVVEYEPELFIDLCFIHSKKDCYVRVINEIRTKSAYTEWQTHKFEEFCREIQWEFPDIHFWCGRNLYNWKVDYVFKDSEPTCEERYSSVCSPRLIDDWWPWLYAKRKNREIREIGTDKDILLIDFVDYE